MAAEAKKSSTSADSPRPKLRGAQKFQRIAINCFIAFHLLAITCWAIPLNGPLISAFRDGLRPYIVPSGLFQSWDMFSPNPKGINSYMEAIVIYQDGSTQLWTFPRMEFLSYRERYVKERYRKYEENLQNGDNSELWPDAARRIARLNSSSAHIPKTVMLVVRWSDILPRGDNSYDRGPWQVNVFYSYTVQPEDLQ